MHVFGKMIQLLKNANRIDDAKNVIERARKMFGNDDLFADRELISLLRESGNRAEALAEVRQARTREPSDYGLIRLEATLLTETGKVDEAVAIIRKLMDTPAPGPSSTNVIPGGNESVSIAVPASDAFSNYLFISNLYSQANRGKEAAEAGKSSLRRRTRCGAKADRPADARECPARFGRHQRGRSNASRAFERDSGKSDRTEQSRLFSARSR
jgi:predicted Zn-dependent protease